MLLATDNALDRGTELPKLDFCSTFPLEKMVFGSEADVGRRRTVPQGLGEWSIDGRLGSKDPTAYIYFAREKCRGQPGCQSMSQR